MTSKRGVAMACDRGGGWLPHSPRDMAEVSINLVLGDTLQLTTQGLSDDETFSEVGMAVRL